MKIKKPQIKRWLTLLVLFVLVVPLEVSMLFPNLASAVGGPVVVPGGVGTNSGNLNILWDLAYYCHGLNSVTDTPKGSPLSCQAMVDTLQNSLGCQSDMFATADFQDPTTSSGTKTLWYTRPGIYKDCYNKATDTLKQITTTCAGGIRRNPDSANWSNVCAPAQNTLQKSLGCSDTLFQANKGDPNHWSPAPSKLSDCQSRVDKVGGAQIPIPDTSGIGVKTKLSDKISSSTIKAAASDSTTPNNGNSNPNGQLTCETFSANPLMWVICPVVNGLVDVINLIDNLITNQLTVNTGSIFNLGTCSSSDTNACTSNAYHTAWSDFRNLSLGLMAVAGLVVLISQSLGFELLDAYMIRKTLPRLLIAAIGITLSWPLMDFLVNLSNDLGFGIRHLIYFPFSSLGNGIDLNFSKGITNIFFGGLATVGAGLVAIPVWIAAGGPGVLLAYAATAGLAVFIAIVVLILRQVAIILLIILAPIAIVSYVLPNTQKVYRFWWDSFGKALMMFPLIAGFIAAGRVFSAISLSQGGILNGFIGFAAYFAPYFLIPATFKFAGSFTRQLGGFVNDRSRGGFDRLRNYRSGQMKSRLERARGKGLYRDKPGALGKVGNFMNKVGMYTLDADEQIPYDLGSRTGLGRGKYNPLGRAGRPLFGRMAGEMAGKKANAFAEQNAKAVEQSNIHYSTAHAILGMRSKLSDGLTGEGLAAMDKAYGIDAEGNKSEDSGHEAVRWQPVADGDYNGYLQRAKELKEYGIDGSFAQTASRELIAKAGILSSFGLHQETQRAGGLSVAAAVAAREGKLKGSESAVISAATGRAYSSGGEELGAAFEVAQQTQMEAAATQNNPAMRRAKNVRRDKNGVQYAVHSDHKVDMLDRDGNLVLDENKRAQQIEAFKTKEAYDSADSLKATASGAAKADGFREMADTIVSYANRERPDLIEQADADDMRRSILVAANNPYTDVDSQKAARAIAARFNKPPSDEEMNHVREEIQKEADEHEGHGHGPGAGGGMAPPPLPGGPSMPPPAGL